MKKYWGALVQLHSFLTSTLDKDTLLYSQCNIWCDYKCRERLQKFIGKIAHLICNHPLTFIV